MHFEDALVGTLCGAAALSLLLLALQESAPAGITAVTPLPCATITAPQRHDALRAAEHCRTAPPPSETVE